MMNELIRNEIVSQSNKKVYENLMSLKPEIVTQGLS